MSIIFIYTPQNTHTQFPHWMRKIFYFLRGQKKKQKILKMMIIAWQIWKNIYNTDRADR